MSLLIDWKVLIAPMEGPKSSESEGHAQRLIIKAVSEKEIAIGGGATQVRHAGAQREALLEHFECTR